MKFETKSVITIEKMDDTGTGIARLADLSAIDSDNDTYIAGAFAWKTGGGQWAPMLPAHDRTAMPFGKARVFEEAGFAYAELHLNLDTQPGKEWHSQLKFDLTVGEAAQEWSYGYGVVDATYEQRGDTRIRLLKRVDVHEVSPVIRGAGAGTGTMAMKSRQNFSGQIDAVLAEIDDIIARAGDIGELRKADGREAMSKARLDQVVALKGKLDALIKAAEPGSDDLALAEQVAVDYLTKGARSRFAGR
ncbi:HK97 family phage prohead protease [Devosia sp.]|uniref:HK97 family phage prohead protease n=1 Tax=Devosia sp. TaxID=1871048 RepID=UPI001AD58B76|nr:HK97 family phage prohead protease [Devosia sp.]MBN9333871.1 HK97 family phage prohead protease [Devosia sp.]